MIKNRGKDNPVDGTPILHIIFFTGFAILFYFILTYQANFSAIMFLIIFSIISIVEFDSILRPREKSEYDVAGDGSYRILAPILLTLFMIPMLFHAKKDYQELKYPLNTIKSFDISEINQSLERIQDKYAEIDKTISLETKEMTRTVENILTEINDKNIELKELQVTIGKMKAQIDYYESLVKLSEKDVKTVINAINQNKYWDYIIAVVIGFFVSVLSSTVLKRYSKQGTARMSD